LIDDAQSLDKLGRRCGFVHVAFGAGGDGFEDTFIVHAGAGHDNAQIGPNRFHAGHDVIEVLAATIAEQHEINVGQLAQIGKRGGDQFQIRFGIEEARNPTNRSGSLSTTATRIRGFLATAAFIKVSLLGLHPVQACLN